MRPIGRVQPVWWPDWHGISAQRWTGPMGEIYFAWSIYLGWLELRIWHSDYEARGRAYAVKRAAEMEAP